MNASFTFIYYIIIFPNSFDKSTIKEKSTLVRRWISRIDVEQFDV